MTTVPVRTYYLEMRQAPPPLPIPPPPHVTIQRLHQPALARYRAIYNAVGQNWRWVDRHLMSDPDLLAIVHDPRVEIHLMKVHDIEAGFSELDRRIPHEVELVYLGLKPAFLGQGLGKYLLNWTLAQAWASQPRRVWLHTCIWDHPAALPTYQKAGFVLVDEKIIQQVVPPDLHASWSVTASKPE